MATYYNHSLDCPHLWELIYEHDLSGISLVLYPLSSARKRQTMYIDANDFRIVHLKYGRIKFQNKVTGVTWKLYTSESHQFCKYSSARAFSKIGNTVFQ